jgi:hypothetical protein
MKEKMEGLFRTDRLPLSEHAKLVPMSNGIVRCCMCGKLHYSQSETFIVFYGNATIGLMGGCVGNNFRSDGQMDRPQVCCRTFKCLTGLLPLHD